MRAESQQRVLLLGMCVLIVGLIASWKYFNELARPFTPESYAKGMAERGLLIEPASDIQQSLRKSAMLINDLTPSGTTEMLPRIFFIDTAAAKASSRLPYSWSRFTESLETSLGTTFVCQRMIFIDAELLNDPIKKFTPPHDAERLAQPAIVSTVYPNALIMFVIYHEYSHLQRLDYTFSGATQQWLDQKVAGSLINITNRHWEEARAQLNSVLIACPTYVKAIDHLAILESRLDNHQLAIELYQRSLKLDPFNAVALQNLIMTLVRTHEDDQARVWIEEMRVRTPKNPESFYWEAILDIRKHRINQARTALRRSIQLYSTQQPALAQVHLLEIGLAEPAGTSLLQASLNNLSQSCSEPSERSPQLLQLCSMEPTRLRMLARQILSAVP